MNLETPSMKAKLIAVVCILIVGIAISLGIQSRFDSHREQASAALIAAEFEALCQEYARLLNARADSLLETGDEDFGAALTDETIPDAEWLMRGPAADASVPDPDVEMMPRFLAFANKHPNSPLAFDALFLIVRRGGPQTANVHGQPWQTKEQALDVVWTDHSQDPRIAHLFDLLGGSLPSQRTEAFLERASESGPNRAIRAAATFHLARYYHTFAQSHKRSAQVAAKASLKNVERYWKIVVTPYLQQFPMDWNKNADEIDRLLAIVVNEFADVPVSELSLTGPNQLRVETVSPARPKTFPNLARSMLFEVNNITPGQAAPEIVGTDADGKSFRLSDYRGKVVLLTFTADWCSDCAKIYPIKRSLVKKYRDRPFVLLSVNRDDTLDDLKASITSGNTTWRCWWDGREGPINRAWNNGGIPDLYLLDDEHIIQNVALSRLTSQEAFEQAIEPLLEKAAARESDSL
jgi:thiol-disulfide isomerase/thioredoxin